MIGSKPTTRRAAMAASLAVALLAGCASVMAPTAPEARVTERATQRWQAMIKGDYEKAYNLTTPSYRAVTSFTRFRAGFGGGGWQSAEVASVNCEAEKCVVQVKIGINPVLSTRFGATIITHIEETWLLEGGQWWLHQNV